MHFAVQKDVFLTLKYGKTRWRPGLHPGPRWGRLRRFPRSPSRLGLGHPSPYPTPLSAFGASILASSALDTRRLWRLEFGVPVVVNLRNDHWRAGVVYIPCLKRTYLRTNPSYRWAALVDTGLHFKLFLSPVFSLFFLTSWLLPCGRLTAIHSTYNIRVSSGIILWKTQ